MIAAIRIRSSINSSRKKRDTLQTLLLTKIHNCMLIPDDPPSKGRVTSVREFVMYGTVSEEMATKLLEKRGRVAGGLLRDHLELFGVKSCNELAKKILSGGIKLNQLREQGLLLPFRLSPASGGLRGIKHDVHQGGSAGDHGERINTLLEAMI